MLAMYPTKDEFGIPDDTMSLTVISANNLEDEQSLRSIWQGHLTQAQKKAEKAAALKHPLQHQLRKKFFN